MDDGLSGSISLVSIDQAQIIKGLYFFVSVIGLCHDLIMLCQTQPLVIMNRACRCGAKKRILLRI